MIDINITRIIHYLDRYENPKICDLANLMLHVISCMEKLTNYRYTEIMKHKKEIIEATKSLWNIDNKNKINKNEIENAWNILITKGE